MADQAPSWFRSVDWPTVPEYVGDLASAISDVTPLVSATSTELAPPIQAQISVLAAVLEGASGLPLGQLAGLAGDVAGLAAATDAAQTAAAIGGLVMGTLDLAVTVAGAAGVATEAAGIVPVIGQTVQVVLAFWNAKTAARAADLARLAECQQRFDRDYNAFCAQAVSWAAPRGTGPEGVTPADLFRPLAYAIRGWERFEASEQDRIRFLLLWRGSTPPPNSTRREVDAFKLPMSIASIYAVLCGDEAQPFPAPWRASWQAVASAIPRVTRRRMWRLVRAICAAANPPGLRLTPSTVGDAGRAAMPALQELVRGLWLRGVVTAETLRRASLEVGVMRAAWGECFDLAPEMAGAPAAGGAWCADRVDLAAPFLGALEDYQARLFAEFHPGDHWTVTPARPLARVPSAVLQLGRAQSAALVTRFARAAAAERAPERRRGVAAGAGGAALSAALAWTLLRFVV